MKLIELTYCDSVEPEYIDEYRMEYILYAKTLRKYEELIKPKVHNKGHVPEVMERFGSLTRYDNMSQERNHQISTAKMIVAKNHTNPTQTLMHNYQSRQLLNDWPRSILRKLVTTNEKKCNRNEIDDQANNLLQLQQDSEVIICNSITIEGIVLETKNFYALKQNQFSADYFYIDKIFLVNSRPRVLGYAIKNCHFVMQYYSYRVNKLFKVNLKELNRRELISGRKFFSYERPNCYLIVKTRRLSNKFKIFDLYDNQ